VTPVSGGRHRCRRPWPARMGATLMMVIDGFGFRREWRKRNFVFLFLRRREIRVLVLPLCVFLGSRFFFFASCTFNLFFIPSLLWKLLRAPLFVNLYTSIHLYLFLLCIFQCTFHICWHHTPIFVLGSFVVIVCSPFSTSHTSSNCMLHH